MIKFQKLGTTRKLSLIALFSLVLTSVTAQIQIKQVGKVHYTVMTSNELVSQRNDSIAKSINDYIQQNAVKNFPVVLLDISDQDPDSKLSNFQELLVYYQKYRGEFFGEYEYYYAYDKEHIGINLTLFNDHYQKGMEAIKYAVENFRKLKKKEKRLSKKKKHNLLTNEDLKSFDLLQFPKTAKLD